MTTTTPVNDERRRVLELLAQGKITTDEAAELLSALDERRDAGASPAEADRGVRPGRFVRIQVEKQGHPGAEPHRVSIRVPDALLRSGMRLGALLRGAAGRSGRLQDRLRARGMDVDFSQIDPAQVEALLASAGEMTIDVDDGRATVRITRE